MGELAPKSKRRAGAFLRIAVSVLILLFIATFVPADEIWNRMRLVPPLLWIAVFLVFIAGHGVAAAKWRWMIGGAVSYPRALQAHFAGLAANIALPGVAGGDLVRAGLVMKGSDRKTALAVGSLADRIIDTAALLVIAAIGAVWLGARAGVDTAGLAFVSFIVIAAGVGGVIFMKPIAQLIRRAAPTGKIGGVVGDVADALDETAKRRGVLMVCAALSIGVQFVFALMNGMIAASLGAGTSLAAWVFAWPLAKLVATLPISFGGIGVREASLAGLMSPLGYQVAGVVAASLVWQTIQISAGVVGALAQGVGRRAAAAEASHG